MAIYCQHTGWTPRGDFDIPELDIGGSEESLSVAVSKTHLVDHVTLRMPAFIFHIPINLHKLFEDGAMASRAFCREAGRVMKVAVDIAVVFIIRVLGTEQSRAEGASEMFDMKFLVCKQMRC